MTTSVIAGKYVLGMRDGEQAVLQDHYVYVDGPRIEAVTRDAPAQGQPSSATSTGWSCRAS